MTGALKWPATLALVGGGPMCLYALERLAGVLREGASRPPDLVIFERSGRFGAGEVNSDLQPATSLMNRVAAQVGLGADESNAQAGALLPRALRPTLHEWLQQRAGAGAGRALDLRPQDIPSRSLHGAALRDAFERYAALLRSVGARIELVADEVVDVCGGATAEAPFTLHAAGGGLFQADRILFVTGNAHSFASPQRSGAQAGVPHGLIDPIYPLERQLTSNTVPAGCTVAIDGFGLTAIDAILHLTEGRGGVFERAGSSKGSGLVYRPSGREPAHIIPFCPSGAPPCCRPENNKLLDPALHYKGRYFTADAVSRLRRRHGRSSVKGKYQLDFDRSVLPVVVLELARAYYLALLGDEAGTRLEQVAQERYEAFLEDKGPFGENGVQFLLEPVQRCFDEKVSAGAAKPADRFDWKRLLDPVPIEQAAGEPWQGRIARFMAWDLANGREGNLRNPVKAACDGVFRDLRSVFCTVVEHGGLTPQSHERFLGGFLRNYMRLSNGAGIEPTAKLLALIECGLVDISIGPAPQVLTAEAGSILLRGPQTGVVRRADLMLQGKLRPFDAADPGNLLYGNLLRRGWARRWVNLGADGAAFCPGGLELTEEFHPVGVNGRVDARLTFMGVPAEGQRFFQSAAARPYCNSSLFTALGTWARECLQDTGAPADQGHQISAALVP